MSETSTVKPGDRKIRRIITNREKQALALRLRSEGLPWAEVAKKAGYSSESAALRAAQTALDRIPQAAVEEHRRIELERLDKLHRLAMASISSNGTPDQPIHTKGLEVAVRISERRAKLLGLDLSEARQAAAAEMSVTLEAARLQALIHAVNMGLADAGLDADTQTRVLEAINARMTETGLAND